MVSKIRIFIIYFSLSSVITAHSQDSAIVCGQAGYLYLEDTIHPMFDSLYIARHCDFVPISITDTNVDSIITINDTAYIPKAMPPTYILSYSALTDPNYAESIAYIENNRANYFTVKSVKIIYKKTMP